MTGPQKYATQIDTSDSNNAQPLIINKIESGARVLEFGPGPGDMTRYLKEVLECEIYTVEYDETFYRLSSRWSDKALHTDIETFEWCAAFKGEMFDYIIFADVLEHLKDPWIAFGRSVEFLREDGSMIVSLPNIAHSSVILGLLHDQFIMNDTGLLDKTHLRFFTFESAKKLCSHPELDLYEMNATYRNVVQTEVFKNVPPIPADLVDLVGRKERGDIFQYIFYLKKKPADAARSVEVNDQIVSHDIFEQQLNLVQPEAFWATEEDDFESDNRLAVFFNRDESEFVLTVPPLDVPGPLYIRFDPCEIPVVLELKHIILQGPDSVQELSIHSHNGDNYSENILIFDHHTDPSIVFEVDNSCRDLVVSVKVELLALNRVPSQKQRALERHLNKRKAFNLPVRSTDTDRNAAAYRDWAENVLPESEQTITKLKARVRDLEQQQSDFCLAEKALIADKDQLKQQEAEFYAAYKALREENDRLKEIFSLRAVRYAYRLNNVKNGMKWLILLPFAVLVSPLIFIGLVSRSKKRAAIVLSRARDTLKLIKNKKRLKLELKYPRITKPVGFDHVFMLRHKIRSIPARKIETSREDIRFNILVPTLRPEIAFGGYICLLHFVKRLSKNGCSIRIVICDDHRLTKKRLIKKWAHKADIQHLLSVADFDNLAAYSESAPFFVCDQERFIAYSGWEGLIAHQFAALTNYKKFIFFIQEYEPIFHDENSIRAVLESAYLLPHVPIFNTRILHTHFVQDKIGIYSDAYKGGEVPRGEDHIVFEHAIADLTPPGKDELEKRTKRKLLFYARPEPHAGRNLYALGMLALERALEKGLFAGAWDFWGIGTFAEDYEVPITEYHTMKIVQRIPQDEYEQFIKGFDVGFSLMMAPHPSILPFEMAAAGMVVVTNEYKYRTSDVIKSISKNIIPCRLNIDSIAEALGEAARKSVDVESRVNDYGVDWNRNWDDAFSHELIESFVAMIS